MKYYPKGKRTYTQEEIDFIKGNYLKISYADIALKLNRTEKAIQRQAAKLSIRKVVIRRWTNNEELFIKNNFKRGLSYIAKRLNRLPSVVSDKASSMGLKFRKPAQWRVQAGYKSIRLPSSGRKTTWRHIQVMEKKLGRMIIKPELVHHVNGIKTDNHVRNLFLCRNKSHHQQVHQSFYKLLSKLIDHGIVRFNHDKGTYYLA